ncbi:MAG: hypothetical protein IPJ71_15595 [Bdellovibrionales bacterium]|nr:hypothetical protein [Bdellovibrionales bacterium]
MKKWIFFVLLGSVISVMGCSSDSDSESAAPTTQVADAIGLVAKGVGAIGTGMTGTALMGSIRAMTVTQFNTNRCDAHGRPLASAGGADLSQSDEFYPYLHTYCAVSIKDGDTVRGGFDLVRSLICTLEKGGIEFSGATQEITGNFNDTDCWPDGGPGDETGTITLSAVGSSPASFNSHYTKGVIFSVASLGLTFKIAANLDSDKIEFITHESWSGAAAGDSAGDIGTMAGELTKSTGVLRFEKRDERVRSDCAASRCGWNRHTRLYAVLTMSNGEPQGVTSLSYGFADIQANAATVNSSATDGYGRLITASGPLSSGIKARLFETASSRSLAQVATVGQYSEVTNTACATSAGFDDAADCTSNTGIGNFSTNAKFTLLSSTSRTSTDSWLSTFSGFNFTAVDLDTDNAF